MAADIHGLEVGQGDAAFAFGVLRLVAPASRPQLLDIVHRVGAVVADVEAFVASIPEELDEPVRLVALPWSVPEDDAAVEVQRIALEAVPGIEAVWFFQCATSLVGGDEDGDHDSDDDDGDDDDEDGDEGGDADDADDEAAWSNGPPPQVDAVPFPIDGYPAIVEELDWEDFGTAFKLAGPAIPGEAGVLRAFHALWLAPYNNRFRNAAVTIDPKRHAAHLWVDRFAAMTPNDEQVHHLMWVLSQLDLVLPIVHAKFEGASMAQKYAGMMDDAPEPFVLGGNPLVAAHRAGGDAAVDAIVAQPGEWTERELAAMLRELAIEIVTDSGDGDGDEDGDDDEDDGEDDAGAVAEADEVDDDEADEADAEDEEDEAGEVDAVFETAEPMAPEAAIAALAVPLLIARAKHAPLRAASSALLHALSTGDDDRAAIAQRVLTTTVDHDDDDDDEDDVEALELDDAFDEDDDDDDDGDGGGDEPDDDEMN